LLLAPCEAAAREKVLEICLEQTVELPASLVPEGTWIREHVVGRLESLTKPKTGPHARRPDAWNAIVSYHADTAGGELTQLVNVIFGNTSMKENVMVVDIELPRTMLREYPGPRFGVHGLRRLLRVPEGPLVMTALKPMGLSSQELAEIAYGFAKGGIDIIKDDHGLADQPYSPYDERVRMCAAAVARANAETGRNVLYAPCINAPAHLIISRAHAARQAGAGAVLMIPGITGLDAMRELAADPSFNLPIIAHPALLGCMLGGGSTNRIAGFSHEVLLGLLPRLAGADATVFPSFGGRFGFSVDECKAINVGCTRVMGDLPAILPSPGGGMTLERIAQMREVYGPDLLLLIGGSLYSHSENLVDGARHFMKLAGRKELYGPLECPHDGYRGHTM
jgi:ribulose-bisphosphate carboxylase large chain